MSDENENGRGGRAPLTLKPRAGAVSTGVVKQSFSHGRSKTVVVETKRSRVGGANLAAPSAAEKRPAPAPVAPRLTAAPSSAGGLSHDEQIRRQRVLEAAREAQDRQTEELRRQQAAEAQSRAAVAAVAAPPPVVPAAPVAAPTPRPEPEAPSEQRPAAAAPPPSGSQTRSYEPSRDRRDDRPSTTTYRPPVNDGASYNQRAPREAPAGRARDDDRRPAGRDERPRDEARPGETVRYSALSPRPAPRDARPAGPRPGAGVRPAAAPSGPEIQRATRQAPRPGSGVPDRDDDEGGRGRGLGKTPAPKSTLARGAKGAPTRREGRLTIQTVAGDEDSAERMRSLASVRRAREREKEKRRGPGVEQAKTAREVVIPDVITVGELANRMATRGVEIIKFLMRQGLMLKSGDVIDSDTAELVASEFGHTVRRVSESDVLEGFIDADDHDDHLESRAPVVTIMGHVDHGKTSLLDALRSTDVAGGEHGGITQHIGAYQVRLKDGHRVTFLDTPGHAAFSAMRQRGANVTDIVVLVVAADDGVMPQTIEAIQHAKAAGAPIIVAVNKIDKPEANSQKVTNELLQHEIVVESLGGDTQIVEVSAKARTNLDALMSAILVQSEIMDLKANPDRTAEGVVIESKLDKGRGAVSTVLVKRGTLKRGDIVVAGSNWGRVRALLNERDEQLTEAGPSTPVEILGLDGAPSPGEPLAVVENEARAREITEYRERVKREKKVNPAIAGGLAEMMANLQTKKIAEVPLVLKADVQGSAEAIIGSLEKLSTDEVRARIILSGAGGISESDVMLAKTAGAPVIGFNVRASKQARDLAAREGVEIRYYAIIYDLLDDLKGVMSGLLAPIQRETFLGNAKVLQAFDISKVGKVAGCRVTEGVVRKGARVRIVRDDIVVLELGTLQTLKRFKDEVDQVQSGQECGMHFAGFQDIREGDLIECFTVEEIKRSL
jgi:translation initiation factor IF-2